MICKDKNLMFEAFQVVAPYLEGFDDSQKLIIVDLVSYFCWNHFPWKECYWMPLG